MSRRAVAPFARTTVSLSVVWTHSGSRSERRTARRLSYARGVGRWSSAPHFRDYPRFGSSVKRSELRLPMDARCDCLGILGDESAFPFDRSQMKWRFVAQNHSISRGSLEQLGSPSPPIVLHSYSVVIVRDPPPSPPRLGLMRGLERNRRQRRVSSRRATDGENHCTSGNCRNGLRQPICSRA